jgi:hypothetical protein
MLYELARKWNWNLFRHAPTERDKLSKIVIITHPIHFLIAQEKRNNQEKMQDHISKATR